MDQRPLEQIEEERNTTQQDQPLADRAPGAVEETQGQDDGPECHEQEEKRRRVFLASKKREHREQRAPLDRPGRRIAVRVEGADGHERGDQRGSRDQQ